MSELIDYKFDLRDYVGELTSYAKCHKISAAQLLAGNMVKYAPRVHVLLIYFICDTLVGMVE